VSGKHKRRAGQKADVFAAPDPGAIIRSIAEKQGYPPPGGIQSILARRGEIMRAMLKDMMMNGGEDQQQRARRFVQQYGERDTAAVLYALQISFQRPEPYAEAPWLYRQYRRAFGRFGGDRRFLGSREYDELSAEWGKLGAQRMLLPLKLRPSRREHELQDLLLAPQAIWEDLLPADPPARPQEFNAPPAGEYTGPESELLLWGPELSPQKTVAAARQAERWRSAVPDLLRMCLDEGLLAGWPGEPASWAPGHALVLLGVLGHHESIAQLASLTRRPDDWLSDLLPGVWAQMGAAAMPALWRVLDNAGDIPEPRALAAAALQRLSQANPKLRPAIVQGLIERLGTGQPADTVLNAYLIMILRSLEEQATTAEAAAITDAVAAAYAAGMVDEEISGPPETGF